MSARLTPHNGTQQQDATDHRALLVVIREKGWGEAKGTSKQPKDGGIADRFTGIVTNFVAAVATASAHPECTTFHTSNAHWDTDTDCLLTPRVNGRTGHDLSA